MRPNLEAIKSVGDGGAGKSISKSGLYNITIAKAYVKLREGTQSKTLNLRVVVDGAEGQSVLFIRQTNNDGKENFEKILLDKLLVVCGIDEVKRLIPSKFKYKEKEYFEDCIQELENKKVIVQVKQEFDKWEGKISERFRVINFFRVDDKATAVEIIEQKDFGKKYNSLDDDYVNSTSYRNGVTAKEAEAYIKAQREANGQKSDSNLVSNTGDDEIPF